MAHRPSKKPPHAVAFYLAQAHAHIGQTECVVIGSLSILGLAPKPIPPGMEVPRSVVA